MGLYGYLKKGFREGQREKREEIEREGWEEVSAPKKLLVSSENVLEGGIERGTRVIARKRDTEGIRKQVSKTGGGLVNWMHREFGYTKKPKQKRRKQRR